jgi:hypothetical protein
VVEIVVVAEPWLNSATATSPLASRLASTRRVPSDGHLRRLQAQRSWSIAMRLAFFRIVWVPTTSTATSLPAISGAAIIAHMAKWLRISVSVIRPGRPPSCPGR